MGQPFNINILIGVASHPPFQILRHLHNEIFTFPQLFMGIRFIFFVLENNQFLKLMAMGYRQHFRKKPR